MTDIVDKLSPYSIVQTENKHTKYEAVPTEETTGPTTLSLDRLLDRIGFGLYQYRLIGIIGLVALTEGAQIIVFTLVLTILQNEWGYSEDVQSAVASAAFLGILIGCSVAGMIADKFGRKWCIIIASALILLVNFLSIFCTDILWYGLSRFLLSFLMGFFAPIGFTLIIENVPINTRANVVIFANCLIFLGELFACLLAWLTLNDFAHGNWKALTIYSSIPTLLAFILGFLYIDESVRYDLVMKNYENVFETINKINDTNGKNIDELTFEEKQAIIEYEKKISRETINQESCGISSLFKGEFKSTTLIIWFDWFVNSFVYFGLTLFMPYIIEQMEDNESERPSSLPKSTTNPDNIGSMALSVLVESSSVIIAAIAIDTNAYGRKTVLSLFYGVTSLFALIAFFMTSVGWYVAMTTATKISLDICVFYQYLYVIEVYPTKIRATGVGLAGGIGKFGAIIMPWIYLILLDYVNLNSPMMLNCILCILALVTITLLPIETKGRELK